MKKLKLKNLSIKFIRVCPILMAISCILKIWIFLLGVDVVAKYINVLLNTFIVLGVYGIGMYFSYCKIHRLFCNFALYGYIWYLIYLIFHIPTNNWFTYIHLIVYSIIFILILRASYIFTRSNDKKLNNKLDI